MNDIYSIFTSWQFLLVGGTVFLIMALFNGLGSWRGVGFYLWKLKWTRKILKVVEAAKVLFLPLIGFGLGWIPQVPRPEQLQGEEVTQFTVALLYAVAGLCSMIIVKFVKKTLEAQGIDIDLDLDPKEQKKAGFKL